MTHNRNHLSTEYSRCNKNGKCIYGFPQPLRPHTVMQEDGRVQYRRDAEDDRWIAPHIPVLIDILDCHIHIDIISSVWSYMYLYKYLHKGPDHSNFSIHAEDHPQINEAKDYEHGRYLSAGEASWRAMGYITSHKEPAVSSLHIHLPNRHFSQFTQKNNTELKCSDLL